MDTVRDGSGGAGAADNSSADESHSAQRNEKNNGGVGLSPKGGTTNGRLVELLLDPRSLQYLMTFGAGLLVLGMVVWMWAVGVFENKMVVAAAMGAATLSLLGGGSAMLRYTRHQIAGQAITLLACMVMPLNLWFYHAQELVTLEGHLWMAGVVCCVLYAASARILKQPVFVYVSILGITLTGLLILADEHVRKLWEIAAPSTLMVIIGLIAIHAERAFPPDGPFSRKRFGLASFWSGIAVMSSGLMLLLGAQLAGWLYYPYVQHWGLRYIPEIADKRMLQLLALGLVIAGTYAYVYSDLVVKRASAFLYLAAFTFLWAEVIAVKLLAIEINEEVAIVALAVTALLVNSLNAFSTEGKRLKAELQTGSLARVAYPLGVFLCIVPVVLGLELHLRDTYTFLNEGWPYKIDVTYVLAMIVAAVSARVGAYVYRHSKPMLSATYFFATAVATLLAARGWLSLLGLKTTVAMAPWLMLVPIMYIVAARLYRGHTAEQPLARVAQLATGVMIAAVFGSAFHAFPEHVYAAIRGENTNLLMSLFFVEATLFYVFAGVFGKKGYNVYLATMAGCCAIWQLLNYWHVSDEYYTLAFALAGLALLIAHRFAASGPAGSRRSMRLSDSCFECGNALLSLSFVAAILLSLSRLIIATDSVHVPLLVLLLLLIASGLLAAWMVRDKYWRRWYVVTAIVEGGLSFLVINVLSDLSAWEKLEIFSTATGVALLVAGHIGWYGEGGESGPAGSWRSEDWVSLCLSFGSMLATMPVAVAVLIQRSHQTMDWTTLRIANELGILVIGSLLVGTGMLFKLRATTITGACTMLVYGASLAFFIHIPEKLQTVAVYMMVGGGTFFTTAVLLSIYRDQLMALPGRIKRHEGVFRVLNWR
ncbi:MAG TPA: hypothetical protein VKX17_28055 [Planctomycetota bacterium]|nr:hypothetical protein [Planctomycetota bacterium]